MTTGSPKTKSPFLLDETCKSSESELLKRVQMPKPLVLLNV